MGRLTTPLSDAQIKRAKPKEKRYKLSDGGGLYLFVYPTGKKTWRVRYAKNKEIVVGEYPAISLAEARKRAAMVRQAAKDGIEPSTLFCKKEEPQQPEVHTFSSVAESFFKLKEPEWSTKHYFTQFRRYERYIEPEIGSMPIDEIKKSDIVRIVESALEKRMPTSRSGGRVETAKKVFLIVSQIFRYALHKDIAKTDPTAAIDLSQILPKVESARLKAITDPDGVRAAFRQLLEYEGIATRFALEFLALTALRPGNVRNMEWKWVDLKKRVVIFPKEAMKGRVEFRLPLTDRLVEIVQEMKKYTAKSRYVFCSPIAQSKPMSENTLNYAHKRLGIEDHNAHGWRSSFSTICYEKQREHGFGYEVIESQLAHKIGSDVKLAYLRSDFLEERRELLEWWEQFLRGSATRMVS